MDFANLSPEDKAQLILQLVGGGDNHPDEAQDEEMLQREVDPKIEFLIERINALESIVEKIVMGAYGAVQNREKGSLLQLLKEKHASDIDGISPIYSKLVGSDPYEDLTGELMKYKESDDYSDDGLDGKIQELLGSLKGRFGGLKLAEEPAAEITVEKTEEPAEGSEPMEQKEPDKKGPSALTDSDKQKLLRLRTLIPGAKV